MSISSVNPATGEQVATFDEATPEQVEAVLARSEETFREWRRRPVAERAALFGELAKTLRANSDELAGLVTLEMGKILGESKGEVEKCAIFCDYIAEHGEELLAPRTIEGGNDENYVRFEPLGTILAVMPWNFPYVQVFRFAPAALTAGNVAVLKHASNVPQCAIAIERMFAEAGFPDGVFQTLLVGPGAVESIISDRRVRGVTLTGSDLAGSKVAALAGRELKTAVMELGGSDPFVVLDDADIDLAVKEGTRAREHQRGPGLHLGEALHRHRGGRRRVRGQAGRVGRRAGGRRPDRSGDPGRAARPPRPRRHPARAGRGVDRGGRRGAGRRLRARRPRHLRRPAGPDRGRAGDAGLPRGDLRPGRRGGAGPRRGRRDRRRQRLATSASAPRSSARTSSGRSGSRREIDAGMIFINTIVVSDPRLPFGGVKRSGFGRELGEWGVLEFVDIKSVAVVASAGQPAVTAGATVNE